MKARALVAKLTLDEKLTLLTNTSAAVPRLNIPAYNWWTEALHGHAGDSESTDFPEPIGLAASFDAPMLHADAAAIAQEVRANFALKRKKDENGRVGNGLDVWAPNINIFRDPRWGRGQETYGEDPYLTSKMGVAFVTGMQGPDPAHPVVIATPKHFAVHSGPEPTRHEANVIVSLHDMEDTYLPAFRAAVVEGHAGSIMCAYNSINGQPACANDFLLKTKLRGDWGFKGYVVSDCDALSDISAHHHYRATREAGVGAAFEAGVDNECAILYPKDSYKKAVDKGDLSQADIDRALVRLFAARYRLGELPARSVTRVSQGIELGGGSDPVFTPEHTALALKTAEESLVLLKNNGILPLIKPDAKIAVIGPLADERRVLRGNYSNDHAPHPVSVLAGLRAALPHAQITLVPSGPFAGDADVMPESDLRTADGKPGLTLSVYDETPPKGEPPNTAMDLPSLDDVSPTAKLFKTTTTPNVDIDVFDPVRGLPAKFKAVWTGSFIPPATGNYLLGLRGVAGKLELDGKPVVSIVGYPGPAKYGSVALEGGHAYPLKLIAPSFSFPGSPSGVLALQLVWTRVSETPEADAAAAAKAADLTIAVVGLTSDLEGEEMKVDQPGFKGGDRTSLDLPADEQRLLEAAKQSGKPLVVVAMNGSALNMSWAKENADAVLEAWYPGERGGTAVARAIIGAVNPAGRLPVTFYKSVDDLPAFEDYNMANRTYRYFKGKPVYPFGYGLSYTRFGYAPLSVNRAGAGYQVNTTVT
ncbi:MAG: glycoside hydrolase family 3 C-terminal domain-containing protein, partial [Alphaproteobacteria bacterium]|nr:glycoside hydrolase family 3 C-terminal domain-containing protein [Alphaproteobacteria bacterium]